MADSRVIFAFDKQTARSTDADGRMRVKNCILSTAEINLYRGSEIPGWEKLGLDPNKVYEMYRDPDEMRKAADTFNGPLMIKHISQTAEEPRKEYQGGSVYGAYFDGKHLRGDLLISDGQAIDLVESGEASDLSCGYRYTPDMKPGSVNGQRFDGTMRDIQGNHVALVDDGRASGTHVADRALTLTGDTAMAGNPNNLPAAGAPAPAASAPAGAPGSAAGEQHEQTALAQVGVALKHIAELLENIHGQMSGQQAAPEGAAAAEPAGAPEGQDGEGPDGQPVPEDAQDGELDPAVAGGAMDEDDDTEGADPESGAMDEDDDTIPAQAPQEGTPARGAPTPTGAMDAKTVQKYAQSLVEAAVKRERARAAQVERARRDVRGVLGDVYAMDSAGAIYRAALDAVGIDPASIPRGMARTAWDTYTRTAQRATGVRPQSEMAMDTDAIGKTQSGILAHLNRIAVKG